MLTIKCNCQKHRSVPLVVCRKPSLATPMWVSTCRCFPSAKIVLPRHKKCDSRSTWQSGVLYSAFCQTPRADQSNTRVRTYLAICRLKQCIKLKTLPPVAGTTTCRLDCPGSQNTCQIRKRGVSACR